MLLIIMSLKGLRGAGIKWIIPIYVILGQVKRIKLKEMVSEIHEMFIQYVVSSSGNYKDFVNFIDSKPKRINMFKLIIGRLKCFLYSHNWKYIRYHATDMKDEKICSRCGKNESIETDAK
jgi:hypothetical protein